MRWCTTSGTAAITEAALYIPLNDDQLATEEADLAAALG